jgi:hypothetical protein
MVVKEYSLKVDTATAQKNVEELNSSFEAQTELIDELENDLFSYETQLKKTSKTNLAARESLNNKIAKTKDALRLEKKGLKDVTKERKKANESLKEAEENAADYGGVLGTLDSKTGGLISGFSGMTKSIASATKGMKLMKIAVIGTGIGALLIAITSLSAAFTSSEEGQNKWNKIMGIIGATVSVFTDRLASLGSGLISLFTDPIETLKGFGKSIKEFVMDKVEQTVENLGFLGSAISKLFKGDFSGALKDAGKGLSGLNKTLNPVLIVTDALIKSTKELTKEILEEGKAAGVIADQRAAADKLDRQLIVDRAKANKERAELLNKAIEKTTFTLKERIGFLQEAGKLEDEITAKEIKGAQLRLSAKIAENALGGSTKDDLEEEANLRANLINLETAKLTKAKEVTGQIIALEAEAAAASLAIKADKKLKDDEAQAAEDLKAAELKTLKDEIKNAEAVTEDERRALEIEKVGLHYDKLIAEAKRLGLSTVKLEEAKVNALNKFNKQNSKNEIKWSEMTSKEKGKIATDGLNNLASILGEETAAGKAAAIASATISTFQSAQSSYASLAPIPIIGPALGFAAAGAAVVSGFAQIKAITKTKVPTLAGKSAPSGGGGSPSAPSLGTPPTIPSLPPDFNAVGSSGTNQLADAIGGQAKQPVQAFVVSNDITTSQSLDRNIVQGATIG